MEERKEEYKKTYNEARQKASAQSSSLDSLAKENVSLKNNIDQLMREAKVAESERAKSDVYIN